MQHLTVIRQADALRHTPLGIVEEPNVVAYVGDVGLTGTDATGEAHGIIDKLVGVVLLLEAQGIDDKRLYAFEIRQFGVGDGLHVGDIGKLAYACLLYTSPSPRD